MNAEKQSLKIKWIPPFSRGEITSAECAERIGITPRSAFRLKARYDRYGNAAFIHGNAGRAPKNKRFDPAKIAAEYDANFPFAPFAVFAEYETQGASYSTVYNALTAAGKMSPKARKPLREKKRHLPRKERPNEGDLVQIDGSTHDWLMNGRKICLHGAIDDATHKVVALYFCENECLLGYFQMLRMVGEKYGIPRAIYSDRSSCFFVSRGATLEEQLAGAERTRTQWQKTCGELGIELIAAYSPQAKGRIERLWQTLQGRLPFIFRFLGIDTVEKANAFLADFIDGFNARFAVEAQDSALHWKESPAECDLDSLLSVRAEKRTRADGSFKYHGYSFRLLSDRAACVRFTLCLSEGFGLRAYMNGRYHDVELCEPLCDVVGDPMPAVEKDLLYRHFYADTHGGRATIRAL